MERVFSKSTKLTRRYRRWKIRNGTRAHTRGKEKQGKKTIQISLQK